MALLVKLSVAFSCLFTPRNGYLDGHAGKKVYTSGVLLFFLVFSDFFTFVLF